MAVAVWNHRMAVTLQDVEENPADKDTQCSVISGIPFWSGGRCLVSNMVTLAVPSSSPASRDFLSEPGKCPV